MKTEKAFVKPHPGFILPRPASEGGGRIPAEGAEVTLTEYWRKRIKYGDALLCSPATSSKSEPEESKASKTKRGQE